MKHRISITLATAGIISMLAFTSCSKSLQNDTSARSLAQAGISSDVRILTSTDRVDSILKGLSADSYSLSFDKPIPSAGITKTSYGTDNYYAVASSRDLKFSPPPGTHLERVVFWKRPTFPVRTCPDMSIDIIKLKQVFELAQKGDPGQYGKVTPIPFLTGGAILQSETNISQYSKIKADRMDAITSDLNPEKYVILGAPDYNKGGLFTRDSYGYADLNAIVFKAYKTNLKDLLKPTLKGCFDPRSLKIIQEKLLATNPVLYKSLSVTPFPQDKNIAILSN